MAAGVSRLSKSIATARVKHHPSTPKRLRQRSQPLLRRRRWSTKTPMVAAGPEQGRRTRCGVRHTSAQEKNLVQSTCCTVDVLYTYWFALFVNVLYCLPWLLTVFILRLWSWSDYVGVGAPMAKGIVVGIFLRIGVVVGAIAAAPSSALHAGIVVGAIFWYTSVCFRINFVLARFWYGRFRLQSFLNKC
jgi:hypothetical protein